MSAAMTAELGTRPPRQVCPMQYPIAASPVQPPACALALSVAPRRPESLWDSTLSPGSSATRDTCASPTLAPSVRSRGRGSRFQRSSRYRYEGHRHCYHLRQLFSLAISNRPLRRVGDPAAILRVLPSRPVSEP